MHHILSLPSPRRPRGFPVAGRSNPRRVRSLRAGVGVHLALATGHGDVDETTGVDDPLAGTALRSLGLLLLVDLGSGGLDLTGTSEGSVDLTHIDCIWRMNGERVSLGSVDGVVADDAD